MYAPLRGSVINAFWLNLANYQQARFKLPLIVRKRFQVLFHSPLRGSFHLSLTVLVRYRSVSRI